MKLALIVGLFLAIIRVWMGFNVPTEEFSWLQAYKDVAHLFMGGLFMSWWHHRHKWQAYQPGAGGLVERLKWWNIAQPWQWNLFWALNAVEVIVAVASRIPIPQN